MAELSIRLPDIGEGITQVELVEWAVKPGDLIREDDLLAAVMTDKATVEIPSLYAGRVVALACEPGEVLAVGAELVRIETDAGGRATVATETGVGGAGVVATGGAPSEIVSPHAVPPGDVARDGDGAARFGNGGSADGADASRPGTDDKTRTGSAGGMAAASQTEKTVIPPVGNIMTTVRRDGPATAAHAPRPEGEVPIAAPAVRARARAAGIDLRVVAGTGPAGRITHADLDAVFAAPAQPPAPTANADSITEIRVIGLRRRIADRMVLANARIPHITVVEEVDVTALEDLRTRMNETRGDRAKLTMLPFVTAALCRAVQDHPEMNAHFDDDAGIVRRHTAVHAGIATMTDGGLMVPVLRHAGGLGPFETAAEIARLAEAARSGKATREELTGSTITITSLGPLGAIATTPIINHPEVAILGINRMAIRPMWDGRAFVPRQMMNISASFDHRVVDGWDAARFVQRIKILLETPALIWMKG